MLTPLITKRLLTAVKASSASTNISTLCSLGVFISAGIFSIVLVTKATRMRPSRKVSSPQVILLTGASAGIGKDAALSLIEQGHIVYGAARRVENMTDLVAAGGHALKLDVEDEASIRVVVDTILEKEGRVDVLINNAGYGLYGSVEDTTMEEARRQFDVNFFGLAAVTKAVIPIMRNQRSGKIINISSMAGKMYLPLGAWYHGVKHAVEGWSDCLRLELGQFGIKVVIIEPGGIETEFQSVMFEPLLRQSKGTPYEHFAETYPKLFVNGSHPSVVSKMISDAIRAKRPKTRYVGGAKTQPILFFRRFCGDFVTDIIALSLFK